MPGRMVKPFFAGSGAITGCVQIVWEHCSMGSSAPLFCLTSGRMVGFRVFHHPQSRNIISSSSACRPHNSINASIIPILHRYLARAMCACWPSDRASSRAIHSIGRRPVQFIPRKYDQRCPIQSHCQGCLQPPTLHQPETQPDCAKHSPNANRQPKIGPPLVQPPCQDQCSSGPSES